MSKPWETVRDGSVSVPIYRQRQAHTTTHTVTWYECGRRLRKSFADPAKARDHAKKVARGLAQLGSSSLTLTGEELLAYSRARQMIPGEAIDAAVLELVEGRKLSGNRVIEACGKFSRVQLRESPSVEACVAEMLAAKEASGRSKEHVRDLRSRLGMFARSFRVPLSSVTQQQVEQWLDAVGAKGRHRRNHVVSIVSLVRWSERRGHLAAGQVSLAGIERESSEADVQIFTPDQLQKLLQHAPADVVPFVAFGAFAGLRHAEIQRLQWDDVHMDHIDIRARNAKTRQRRLVPILPALRSWIDPLRGEGRVCRWEDMHRALGKLKRASGVQWVRNGLRHSFGTYRMALVQSEQQVALEMGNSPGMIFRHYRANATKEQAEAWFSILRK
jgi:integrase